MKHNQQKCCHSERQQTIQHKMRKPQRDLTWVDLVAFYPAPQECLETFLVASAAEVVAGVKPANLIRIINRALPCGRSVFNLWHEYGADVLAGTVLSALTIKDDEHGVLLLLYRPELLEKRLQSRTMQSFLRQRGYQMPITLENSLLSLVKSFAENETPDEVGFFLGYPAKDVKGFCNGESTAWNGRCLWRIYGPPARSLKLYQHFCDKRRVVTNRLAAGIAPRLLLKAA